MSRTAHPSDDARPGADARAPYGGEFTATQFLAEVDGHPDDTPVRNALEELAFFTTDVKILGVYAADPFRAASST